MTSFLHQLAPAPAVTTRVAAATRNLRKHARSALLMVLLGLGALGLGQSALAEVRWSVGVGVSSQAGYFAVHDPWWPGPRPWGYWSHRPWGWWDTPVYIQPAPPQVVVVHEPPVQYVEAPRPSVPANAQTSGALPNGFWYYCEAAKGYYPYVKECKEGWLRVPPVPPSP